MKVNRCPIIGRAEIFLMVTACLTLLAIGCLKFAYTDAATSDTEKMTAFHRSVGGIGMGASVSPVWDITAFDSRMLSGHPADNLPVPGIYSCSIENSLSVLCIESLCICDNIRERK